MDWSEVIGLSWSCLLYTSDVDPRNLNTNRLRAQYSLLHAMALDKNYIDTTDISVEMCIRDRRSPYGKIDPWRFRKYAFAGIHCVSGGIFKVFDEAASSAT